MPGRYLSLHLWACGFVSLDVRGLESVLQKLLHATEAQIWNGPDGGEKEGRTQLMLYFLPKQAASRGGDGRVSMCPPQHLYILYSFT